MESLVRANTSYFTLKAKIRSRSLLLVFFFYRFEKKVIHEAKCSNSGQRLSFKKQGKTCL